MQVWRDVGQEKCWTGVIQDSGMKDMRDVGQVGCRTGRMQDR